MAASNHQTGLPALIAARRLGLPFFYEMRGFWEVTRASRDPDFAGTLAYRVQVLLETAAADGADHVFTLTEPMREELRRRGVTPPITLLPNSCDPARFAPRPPDRALGERLGLPPGVPVIGYVGTFVQYEGIEHLAVACARLAERGIDFRLLLVGDENPSGTGDGPVTQEVRRIAAESGLGPRLVMPGRVPHDEVGAYYSLVDIAAFPRKPQPVTELVSPIKPLEALAMEKAVVVSSVRPLAEMIADGDTGLVFAKGEVEGLADALARLAGDPALRHRLGKAGRAWVLRERSWAATARRVVEVVESLRREVKAGP
jgi:glycosyltransferase involved in cell wall biosynthesis